MRLEEFSSTQGGEKVGLTSRRMDSRESIDPSLFYLEPKNRFN